MEQRERPVEIVGLVASWDERADAKEDIRQELPKLAMRIAAEPPVPPPDDTELS